MKSLIRSMAGRLAYRVIRGVNQSSSLRAWKRAAATPWFTLCVADSASELDRWESLGWGFPGEVESLRASCLAPVPITVAVAAAFRRWRVGQARGSRMWSTLGIPGWWLGGVWVHPAVRGMGLGESLVNCVEEKSASLGHAELFLNVDASNEPAIRLYQKLGYTMEQRENWTRVIEAHFERVGHPGPQVVMRRDLAGDRICFSDPARIPCADP